MSSTHSSFLGANASLVIGKMAILTRSSLSLDAWAIISIALFANGTHAKRSVYHHAARLHVPDPDAPADPRSFTLRLGPAWPPSPSPSFITHLTIESACVLNPEYLRMLPDMPNLGLLRVVEQRDTSLARPRVTDRLIRGWAEGPNPFPALRMLQLSCCVEVTPACLRYLGRFPVLVYFSVRGLPGSWHGSGAHAAAREHGWRTPGDPDGVQVLMLRYFASCLGVRDGLPERLRPAAALVSRGKLAGLSHLFDGAPMVEFGGPTGVPPWDGGIPGDTDVKGDAVADLGTPADPVSLHDNPAWWLYAAIGRVILCDRDLEPLHGRLGRVEPASGGWVLPPRPILSLSLAPEEPGAAEQSRISRGGEAFGSREHVSEHYRLSRQVFIREEAFKGVEAREAAWVPAQARAPEGKGKKVGRARETERTGGGLRQRKKRRMGDVLSSMAG